ncbi:MAG: exodeoxyribonuclease III [Phreatobacter sp.]|uniref:exodeoxyribonuclease III n=1 Tax=Phreatobacter sp. TaxID=1966341 RepID=UPI001A48B684|nr:exodeoxyribonuclease III [Phreatobacter sp.]MBL8571169.1 exodeoxyribonuclease III [Phreatobacter sp.]
MPLTVATWNINSVRLRIDTVARFVDAHRPDVLCLQETKCMDGQFPLSDVKRMGYDHVAIHGQKGYHGVAVFSRHALKDVERKPFCGKQDARHIAVTLAEGPAAGTRIHNFYVPAGGDEPDPAINDKFAHKLGFLDEMEGWDALKVGDGKSKAILVGDLNIAPLEHDVWSSKQLAKVVSHTPLERRRLTEVSERGGWIDMMRSLTPEPEKLYTWWSYRSPDWAAANKGRRLDHIWLSPALTPAMKSFEIVREARGWDRPSDHVPVIATLDF